MTEERNRRTDFSLKDHSILSRLCWHLRVFGGSSRGRAARL